MTDLRCAFGFHRWYITTTMTSWVEEKCLRKRCKARRVREAFQ